MTNLPSKKEQLFQLIRGNPSISQQELADQLQLSRSAVAGHIASLIRDKRILGRAYVLPDVRPVICIGGANIDRKLRTLAPLQMGTSNPVSQHEAQGGVARNIAENLARLGRPVKLLCAVGDDASGQSLLSQAEAVGIDTKASLQIAGSCSGSYTALLDDKGEMLVALAHMELCDAMTPDYLRSRQFQRGNAVLSIADLNLPLASVQLLVQEAREQQTILVIVAVSKPKMARLPVNLHGLRLLILNLDELEQRAGKALDGSVHIAQACLELQNQGVLDVIVTMGAGGVFYTDSKRQNGLLHMAAPTVAITDVTGAGDAFAAGVCWSLYDSADNLELACQRGLRLAALTLQSDATVYPGLTQSLFLEE
ncbi:MAG: winged helix-turn-helix transcriptional regulator [Burkholderiales bacterium]|nr:winged helix-turn-helix transcriptional regulator [Burkholderiales bacterium]